jgi:hypothetical protein
LSTRNAPAAGPALAPAANQETRRVAFGQQAFSIPHVLAAEPDIPEFAIRHRRQLTDNPAIDRCA